MNAIFLYCLAYAVKCTGIELHEYIAMANHYHVVFSDPRCELPKFEQILNSFLARAVNRSHGMSGTYWERESFSAPGLPTGEDLMERCVYVLTNACSANLVERAQDWGGATSWSLEYGRSILVPRPSEFFSENMPAELELAIVRPPMRPELTDSELREEIRRRVREREEMLAHKRRVAGVKVLGMSRVFQQSIHDNPDTPRPRSATPTRSRSRSSWALIGAGQRSRDWIVHYRDALKHWIADRRDEVFPCGTYLMRVRFGVACASP